MINLMVWVRKTNRINGQAWKLSDDEGHEVALRYLRSQVDNSLRMGWKPEQVVLFTNFPFAHNGVYAQTVKDVIEHCSFLNKWTALKQYWDEGGTDNVWYHDLDAWQASPLEFPEEVKQIGFVPYINGMQGGSVFIRYAARNLIDEYLNTARELKQLKNDEHLWNRWQRGAKRKDITILNTTYNVGMCKWEQRYKSANRPIKVVHTKPDEHWNADYTTINEKGDRVTVTRLLIPIPLRAILMAHKLWHPSN